jgi:glycosyltransferase involved in cell wall biosynthesis
MNKKNLHTPRVAVLGGHEGCRPVTLLLHELAQRAVPSFAMEVIGEEDFLAATHPSDPPACDLLHVCAPGPAGRAALNRAAELGLPAITAYHPDPDAGYATAQLVLSPSRAADLALGGAGVGLDRIRRWRPGVDAERFTPAAYDPGALPDGSPEQINLLYVGRLAADKEVGLLAEAFQRARETDPRLHLILAGDGPLEAPLRAQLQDGATFLGWTEPDRLATLYATADLLVWPCRKDFAAPAILEAQACGMPVLAAGGGGAADLIDSGRSGCLVEPTPAALAEAIGGLARRPVLRERLSSGALAATRPRTWERSLAGLGEIWGAALAAHPAERPAGSLARAA